MEIADYGVRLSVKGNTFVLAKKGGKARNISPAEVDQILVMTSGVTITSKAIRLAVDHGIDVVFLDSRGLPYGRVFQSEPIKTVETRKGQYLAIIRGDSEIPREIIKAKVRNQANHVKFWFKKLGVQGDDYKQIEGKTDDEPTAARYYWHALSRIIPMKNRDPESTDGYNVSFNYAYAILYSNVHRALQLVGLDPYAGFVHKDRSGRLSLVYDFSEMFKPVSVDFPLVSLFVEGFKPKVKDGVLDAESRKKLADSVINALNSKVKDEAGEVRTCSQAIRAYALKLASAVRGEEKFRGFVKVW
ncbi:CRISPR-associated endonuclease Cas1 [Stygiolobus caldivivus]|uniref:CRISPR-associated endonuclease Cas1 n=1 Tax=Stygiolobus caldivivus TaxID=2824673 RepID=A0A8D5U686_9CREN|nr:CRISPR-associated endonuclease Cas1 [Stygiolobus caldivivus]BCU69757.1 CRISPR-associated endonuclease Cas1 [Stygiolobus caldivivus]